MSRKSIKMKPGKGPSVMGFFVGIVFCVIGLFIAIPMAGMFGVLWTLVAVGITIYQGMNAFSEQGIPTHEIIIEEDEPTASERSQGEQSKGAFEERDVQKRLEEAKRLYDLGLITEEEYTRKKTEILEDL